MHPGFPVLLLRRKEQVFLSVKTNEQSLMYVTAGQFVCSDVHEVYFVSHFEHYAFMTLLPGYYAYEQLVYWLASSCFSVHF